MSEFVYERRPLVIGCNAYWREVAGDWPPPDWIVCYDRLQADLAEEFGGRILIPQRRDDGPDWTALRSEKWYEASPHRGTEGAEMVYRTGWTPENLAIGNFAGMLAFQLALILRVRRIVLVGVDCSGAIEGENVRLSAVADGTPGYGPMVVPRSVCRDGTAAMPPMPSGQYSARMTWQALAWYATRQGIDVRRWSDSGALDFVPVLERAR